MSSRGSADIVAPCDQTLRGLSLEGHVGFCKLADVRRDTAGDVGPIFLGCDQQVQKFGRCGDRTLFLWQAVE